MLQKYIRYCTKKVLDAINIATMELVNMGHTVFTTEFLLLGLLVQNDSSIITIMDQLKLDTDRLKKRLTDDIFASLENQATKIAKEGNIQLTISGEVDKYLSLRCRNQKLWETNLSALKLSSLRSLIPNQEKSLRFSKMPVLLRKMSNLLLTRSGVEERL